MSSTGVDGIQSFFTDMDMVTRRHLTAGFWSILIVLFGYIIIEMDTRAAGPTREGWTIRDRILGIEQRYFVVFLNGVLLYGTLIYLLHTDAVQS